MDRPDALAAYIRELRKERDAWLYQHALNKVRVITRSMKPDEKEAYLRSSAFGNTLAAIRRRDSVDQALSRGELPLSWQRAEFDRLAPLIRQELSRGNDIRLGFLRAVSDIPDDHRHGFSRFQYGFRRMVRNNGFLCRGAVFRDRQHSQCQNNHNDQRQDDPADDFQGFFYILVLLWTGFFSCSGFLQ